MFCCWYYAKKHWLANNVLGICFSVEGIEHLSLGSVQTGAILLSGLFFYDIFWVFCTPVMVWAHPKMLWQIIPYAEGAACIFIHCSVDYPDVVGAEPQRQWQHSCR